MIKSEKANSNKNKSQRNKEPWNSIKWNEIEEFVHKLQTRIYTASKEQKTVEMKKMQRILINSIAAKMKAVRAVSQDNRGNKIAGIDGIQKISAPQRYTLADSLKIDGKCSPIKRVWISKPGKDEKIPLGIPTIQDRAKQKLLLMALEPEWEAKFEPNSYGFRPGRSCQDAIEAIFISINQKPKWVLKANIEKCFDQINHKALTKKLNTFPEAEKQIESWLKAGVLENDVYEESNGIPQRGVFSPFLANVALHGLESHIKEFVTQLDLKGSDGKALPQRTRKTSISFIRYADDFVILHAEIEAIKRCPAEVEIWLKQMGLKLKDSKTQISHTLGKTTNEKAQLVQKGFDFLGFNIRQYPIGKYRVRKTKKALNFRTLIKPSKDKVIEHMKKMKMILKEAKKPEMVLANLNPMIIGWARYYQTVVSYKIFKWCDAELFKALLAWTRKTHKKRSRKWQNARYFHTLGTKKWTFGIKKESEIISLKNHTDIPIERHIKVKDTDSPYNGNWMYWSNRLNIYPLFFSLIKNQKGRCNWCKRPFFPGDIIEKDHIVAKSQGGKNITSNFQLLHGHCHDQKKDK